ncbi:hypothetical protein GA0116948_104153 [Chitinophaga costaii]|uniref:Uncharacterized protein n=1 Tax=Chitinophaga costaii TaxID=1335309 RepID=A0A1C4CJ24_9BACT|nr:DUF5682 family protein [Chitinophaga costaii]PUZ27068.1 hypothetical protein DCM91_07520 [Chitinophaga costaii]SCC19167.1 hypothetical protein GA0116948_104153 [Chitinophaga costaii]
MATHVLGIRHHGPGSARNVRRFLETLQPDIVLVEGPPDADPILQWVNNAAMKPPVAILCFQPDQLLHSVFYPFAEFSPEWQAILYARQHNIPVRFMDLPVAHVFALEQQWQEKRDHEKAASTPSTSITHAAATDTAPLPAFTHDPVAHLARAAGFSDGEKWWEHMFEFRQDNEQVFEAVTEAMQVLREAYPKKDAYMERLREAWMRKTIRQAEKEMYTTAAVICGAWHAPALQNMPKQKEDNDLLKNLPKVKVECTWIPWTYNRLSFDSGYGAGIHSPGWYHHTWHYPADDGTRWMAKVAALLREKQMDTSVAHVIEAVRLAESLAALRGLSKAGLEELNEATLSVLCHGEPMLLELIHNTLIVSDTIGEVPTDIPKPPLQSDIEKTQKRLRLPATADFKDYTLDLRKENDLERSIFLHRLQLLGIPWGENQAVAGKGTFKEQWRLQWEPEYAITIIEKGNWGNTVQEAATQYVHHQAQEANSLTMVCGLLANAMPAALPQAVETLIHCINNLAAATGDVLQLMEVVPGLVNVARYGNVRNTDADMVTNITSSMIIRICISLPAACTALDETAAQALTGQLYKMDDAIRLLQQSAITEPWQQTLYTIARQDSATPMVKGYATRLLADHQLLQGEALMQCFYFGMSHAQTPASSAAWLEGFLKGSGTFLLLDPQLWHVIHHWVSQLTPAVFEEVLPLLRRTFSHFTPAERRKLGEKAKQTNRQAPPTTNQENDAFDPARAWRGVPVVLQLLGIQINKP